MLHTCGTLFVECRASEEKTLERLKERRQQPGEVSDATVAIYLRQQEEPLTEMPESIRMIVNTEGDPEEAAGQDRRFSRETSRPSQSIPRSAVRCGTDTPHAESNADKG